MISVTHQRLKYMFADLLTGNLAILFFDMARYYTLPRENTGADSLSSFLTYTPLLWEQALLPLMLLCVYGISGYYNRPFQKSRLQELFATSLTTLTNTLLVYFALLTNQATSVRSTNYELLVYLFLILHSLTYLGRWLVTSYTAHRFRSGRW